jgi:hypothetical protein
MTQVHRLANTLAFERRCISTSGVRASSPFSTVCLKSRALRARRIGALGASSYLRYGTLWLAEPAVGRPIAFLMIRVQYPKHIDFYAY